MLNERGNQLKTYAIYQLPFESEHSRDLSFMEASEVEAITHEFRLVALIDGTSLDHVFETSNCLEIMPERETLIDRIQPMHSISVGDIIVDTLTDVAYLVADYGFDQIEFRNEVV